MDKQLDELNALRRKLDVEEAKARNSEVILENKKALFPAWTFERMQKEAIDEPNTFWLEPKKNLISRMKYSVNSIFFITPRSFLVICFEKIEKSLISNNTTNKKLFSFYLKYAKPQYDS